MGVLDTMEAASKARIQVELIMDEALNNEWRRLQDDLAQAAEQVLKGASLAKPTGDTVDRMEEIRGQVEASKVVFAFERLDWRERVRIQAEHPPRDGNRLDAMRGYNLETFTPVIIRKSCVSVSGTGGDVETEIPTALWDKLLGTPDSPAQLGYGQIDLLFRAATKANDDLTAVPPSARSWQETQDSGASLAQPGPGTSPQNGSKAGSRRTTRKSTATKKAASPA